MTEWIRVNKAATICQRAPSTINEWARDGVIRGQKDGHFWLVAREDIKAIADKPFPRSITVDEMARRLQVKKSIVQRLIDNARFHTTTGRDGQEYIDATQQHRIADVLRVGDPNDTSHLISSRKLGAMTRCHPRTIQSLAHSGKIPAKRIGGRWMFRPEDVDTIREIIEERQKPSENWTPVLPSPQNIADAIDEYWPDQLRDKVRALAISYLAVLAGNSVADVAEAVSESETFVFAANRMNVPPVDPVDAREIFHRARRLRKDANE